LNGISKEKREKEKQLRRQRHTLRFSGCNLSRNFTSQFEKIAIIEIAEEEEKKLANQNVTTPSVVEVWRNFNFIKLFFTHQILFFLTAGNRA